MAVLYDRVHSTVEAIVSVMIGSNLEDHPILASGFLTMVTVVSPLTVVVPPSKQPNWDDPPKSGLVGPVYHPSPCRRGCLY